MRNFINIYLLLFLLFTFFSCKKCQIKYVNTYNKSSFIGLDCRLYNNDIDDLENNLMIQINYNDIYMKNMYLDSINIFPIYKGTDTLKLLKKDKSRFMFSAYGKKNMDILDVKVLFYSKDLFVKNDTSLVFKDLKRVEDCNYTSAFH